MHKASKTPLTVELGRIVATQGALDALTFAGVRPIELLARHQAGDWGDVCREDARANNQAVKAEGRILSAYILPTSEKVWVITEADRSSTCLLLPSEY